MASNDIPDPLIQCKICKKRYEDPRLLPCLHTYCKACLERSVETHNGKLYLFCLVCQYKVTFSEYSDVENLPCNLIASRSCENCKKKPATSYCFKCNYDLCGNCVEAHKQDPSTKKHEVKTIKESNMNAMVKSTRCATHSQKALKMFCCECEKPVCELCISGEEHKKHSLISMEKAVDDIDQLLEDRAHMLLNKLEKVYASEEELESNVHEARKEIRTTCKQILTAVESRENDLHEMLYRIRDQKRDKLKRKEQALKDDLAQVLESCSLSEREDDPLPETAESDIKYKLEEEPVLDTLKEYLQFIPTDFPELDGTFPCGIKQCKTCSFIDSGTVISAPKSKFYIKHRFTCLSTHVIYCISCSRCGLLYIGETKSRLSKRFGEHRSSVENHYQGKPIVWHFTSGDHRVSDMKVRALLPCLDYETRKYEESNLIEELGTLYPFGLNKTP